jgi:hypothetical protein
VEIKHLEALLKRLKDFGVTSYQDADCKLTFGAVEQPPAEMPTGEDDDRDMSLPDKVFDPRKAIAKFYEKHGAKRA